jgi:iron-sulfur cluster assembly protein
MTETQEAVIRITPLAAEKAKEILARYGKEGAAIRVYIKSGGCSGFQYGMAVDERELAGCAWWWTRGPSPTWLARR